MLDFFVIAHGGSNSQAPARCRAAGTGHLKRIAPCIKRGGIIAGGAFSTMRGMVGSVAIVRFPTLRCIAARQVPYDNSVRKLPAVDG
jgi:hypothetical protein